MRLVTFHSSDNPQPRTGVQRRNGVLDLPAHSDLPGDMIGLLAAGADALAEARRLAGDEGLPVVADADAALHAPVPHPGKVLALGMNYADHIREMGREPPKVQVWFNKQHNCVNAPWGTINRPLVSECLDHEAELVVVIGERCKHVRREDAPRVVAGYCCGNDLSVRDWQRASPTMHMGKSFDTHGPFGPAIVTPDEAGDPHALDVRCWVNGALKQHSNTRHMVFDVWAAIEHLTKVFPLDVGDVLFMGTPAGVGAAEDPPRWLREGDVVRVEVAGLGHLEHRVVPEPV